MSGPIAGVILAAGASSRFGAPKLLQPWGDGLVISQVVETALLAGLQPVRVVSGAFTSELAPILSLYPVQVLHNPDWQEGQSTSFKLAITSITEECEGAVFLLADQPQVSVHLLDSLIAIARQGAQAVAPIIADRRANPVYFRRDVFPFFQTISGDEGGRSILRQLNVRYIDWLDDLMASDIDTPADYERLHRFFFGNPPQSPGV